MYAGEPSTAPVRVMRMSPMEEVFFEMPQSRIFGRRGSTLFALKMLAGLRSRWTMPVVWAEDSERATPSMSTSA